MNKSILFKMDMLSLPDDKLYQICDQLDDIDLSQLVQSHGRFYQVCEKILSNRRKSYIAELDRYSENFVFELGLIIFHKVVTIPELTDGILTVTIQNYGNRFSISQSFIIDLGVPRYMNIPKRSIEEIESLISWINPKIEYNRIIEEMDDDFFEIKRDVIIDLKTLYQTLDIMKSEGYFVSSRFKKALRKRKSEQI